MKRKNSMVGVWLAATSGLLLLGAVASGCGDDGDPLAERCANVCQVDPTDPCGKGTHKDKCIADCRALAGEAAAKGFKGTACGECVADLFEYSGKRCESNKLCTFGSGQSSCEGSSCSAELEVCFGAQGPTGMDVPECTDLCIEKDI